MDNSKNIKKDFLIHLLQSAVDEEKTNLYQADLNIALAALSRINNISTEITMHSLKVC